jgi:hypothetical protein
LKKPLDPHRKHLLAALQADLIGPYDPETGDEVLALPPLRWYLTGFLVPEGMAHAPEAVSGDADEEIESGDDEDVDVEGRVDPGSKQQPILPSSIGLSVLLPARASADAGPDQVEVEVGWGEYLLRSTSEEITTLCRARGMNADKYLPNGQRKQPAELWERAQGTAAAGAPRPR